MTGRLPIVHIRTLGRMCYREAFQVQKEAAQTILHSLREKNSAVLKGYLYIVEHNPVFTVGTRSKQYLDDETKLKHLNADFVKTDRGGLITFHGPGQLVSYPVIYLGNFRNKGIKWFVKELEQTGVDTCSYFGLKANTNENIGVWIDDRKVASIGVQASRFVTTHGIAINCNVDLEWFSHIVPCGIPNVEVTSLSKELKRNVSVEETVPVFIDAFQKHFPCQLVYDT